MGEDKQLTNCATKALDQLMLARQQIAWCDILTTRMPWYFTMDLVEFEYFRSPARGQ
jgi:hypothetical protein